jgi:hypothetical protein
MRKSKSGQVSVYRVFASCALRSVSYRVLALDPFFPPASISLRLPLAQIASPGGGLGERNLSVDF